MNIPRIIMLMTSDGIHDRRMQRIKSTLEHQGCEVLMVARRIPSLTSNVSMEDVFHITTSRTTGPLMYYSFNRQAAKFVLSQSFDILYAVDLDTLYAAHIILKNKKVPFIFDAHEYYTEVPELHNRILKKWIWKSLGKNIIPKSQVCWTVSQHIAERLSARYNAHFEVVRNVPPLRDVQVRKENRANWTILYLGVLNKGRGLEVMISCLRNLKDVHFLILGKGDLEEKLQQHARSCGVEDQCEFVGWVPDHEHANYFARADMAINLLVADSESYRLSLANKFFDYVHAGLPSIQMNYPEYAAHIKKYEVGYTIESLTEEALLDAVQCMKDQTILKKMRQACEEAKAEWNWEKESQHMLGLMRPLLDA